MDVGDQEAPAACGAADCSGLDERGYILVALLIGLAVASVWMSALLPAWRQQVTREREAELIFRGQQYARAIYLYQLKNNNNGPQNIDDLVSQHFLRRKWKDPINGEDFLLVPCGQITPGQPAQAVQVGQAGVCGVKSKSNKASIKVYQNQQEYDLWVFNNQTARTLMAQAVQKLGGTPQPLPQQGQPGQQPGRPTPPGGAQPGRPGTPFPGQPGQPPGQGPGRGVQPGGGVPPGPPPVGRGRGAV